MKSDQFRMTWTVDPVTGVYSSSHSYPTGIPNDPVLAAYGEEQALELAEKAVTLDPKPQIVYSSPFYRCIQTITPTYKKLANDGEVLGDIRIDTGLG